MLTTRQMVLVLLVLIAAPMAHAVEFEDRRAGIRFDVPSWWLGEEREKGWVFATKDETLVVMLWVPRGRDLREAVNELDSELSAVIQKATTDGQPEWGELNGMETVMLSGRGRIDRTRVEWSVVIIDARKPVFLLAFGETGKYERHTDALLGFIQTIRRR